jgi:glycosyltransferase involved in cell wall biosynthesis
MLEKPRLWLHRRADPGYWEGDPLVSVYIPTHNRCDLLFERALPSVLVQTYRNIEVVVAADRCMDRTVSRLIEEYFDDNRVDWLETWEDKPFPPKAENFWFAGRVQPANAALRRCSGTWIATIDDDDIWEPDCIESLLRFAHAGDWEFVSASGATPKGRIEPYDVGGVKVGPLQTWLYRSYLRFMRFNPRCWKKSWNRVCDTDLQDRFRRAGVRMGYLDRVLYRQEPRPGTALTGLAAYREDRAKTEAHFTR